MAKHTGLGRGLDALIQGAGFGGADGAGLASRSHDAATDLPKGITRDADGALWADISLLRPNPKQPRTVFDEGALSELTESIKREGVLSPVIAEAAADGTFTIIAGERRVRAAKNAGLDKIPVQLRHYSEQQKLEVALIENIQRTDLNPLEEAHAYYDLMELGNLTQDQVAERVGKRRSTVANCLRLLNLSDEMQEAVAGGDVTPGHARAILSLDNTADRENLYRRIKDEGLSVRQAELAAAGIKESRGKRKAVRRTEAASRRDPNLTALEQRLTERLGTKVRIQGDFKSGVLAISYFSADDLDRIFNLIVPDAEL